MMTTLTCKHPRFKDYQCMGCGRTQKECGYPPTKSFQYICPRMSLSLNEITRLRDEDLMSLIRRRKLHLILDLDNTLIHTTKPKNLRPEDIHYLSVTQNQVKEQLGDEYIYDMQDSVHLLKKRPGATYFLKELSTLFDISVYTLAGRRYTQLAADILDPNKYIFRSLISREDCTSPGQKGLDIVLSHERLVIVVDDIAEIWRGYADNLVQIEPYKFFDLKGPGGFGELVMEEYSSNEKMNIGKGKFMDDGLYRIMNHLRIIHGLFYFENSMDFVNKDARAVLQSWIYKIRHSEYGLQRYKHAYL